MAFEEPCDPLTVAPALNDKGSPDLYNHFPTRIVTLAEAKARGWTYFYETTVCRYGHQAPRFVSNTRLCVDCRRTKDGKEPIGVKAGGSHFRPQPAQMRKPPDEFTPRKRVDPTEPQPDAAEKRFLEVYAMHQDLDRAAAEVRLTRAQIEARLSYSKVFRDAVQELEERLGLTRTPVPTGPYEWTDEKRHRLVTVFIDTGDLATARDAIRVTPSEYFLELERNGSFAAAIKEAEPKAFKALEERAIQLALAGNDKLLTKILTAKMPEYRESVKVDVNQTTTVKLDDKALNAKLATLLGRHRNRIIDAEVVDVTPRALPAPVFDDASDLI